MVKILFFLFLKKMVDLDWTRTIQAQLFTEHRGIPKHQVMVSLFENNSFRVHLVVPGAT